MSEIKYIPYGRHDIDDNDIDEVINVLKGDWLTQGDKVPLFERGVLDKVGASYAVEMNSATSALHLACLALDVGPSDYVWTSPNSFVASANCALYCGASIDFIDIDNFTHNISISALERKLFESKKNNTLPKVIIPVHFAGLSCEMDRIKELSIEFGFKIIEDASHAIGAKYKNEYVGSCKWSDIAIFSFHPVKIITSGEGGMAITNNEELSIRMQLLRTSGITKEINHFETKEIIPPWYYEQIMLGFNYRMNDIQAALGLSQLKKLNLFIQKRNQIAQRYNDYFSGFDLQLPLGNRDYLSSFHLYVILLNKDTSPEKHRELFTSIQLEKIGVNLHYMPIYLQPFYRKLGFKKGLCPVSENYSRRAISLPIFPGLSLNEQERVTSVITRLVNE